MTEWVNWSTVDVVVEYGPGTGVFTEQILAQKRREARYLGIERNPRFVGMLRERFPGIAICNESVERVREVCGQQGLGEVDVIICGLPWASFTPGEQDAFLGATTAVLPPGGKFATFAYLQGLLLPGGLRFRSTLHRYFATVSKSRTVWANIPPAFVYQCIR